jgi:hypothetical protein
VPVSGGSFSTSVDPQGFYNCTLRAVPAGTTPADLTNYVGTWISLDTMYDYPANSFNADAYSYFGYDDAAFEYDTLGFCGVQNSYIFDPSAGTLDTTVFGCSSRIGSNLADDASSLQLDGKNAFAPAQNSDLALVAGYASVQATRSRTSATGDSQIVETDPLMTCSNNAWAPTPGNCPSISVLPVKLIRTITVDHLGYLSTLRDRYESTDGNSHTLSLGYRQQMCLGDCNTGSLEYSFPGGTTLTDPTTDVVNGPFADGATMLVRDPAKSDGDTSSGRAAVSYSPGPDTFAFKDKRTSMATWNSTIPAGGAFNVITRFAQSLTSAGLADLTSTPLTGGGIENAKPAPGTPSAATVASGKFSVKYDKKKKVLKIDTGKKVSCPAGGGSCTVSVTLSAKYKKGKKTKTYKLKSSQTITAGAVAGIVIAAKVKHNPLYKPGTKGGENPLNAKQLFTGTLTATAAGATPTTTALKFKVKLPKIPKKK